MKAQISPPRSCRSAERSPLWFATRWWRSGTYLAAMALWLSLLAIDWVDSRPFRDAIADQRAASPRQRHGNVYASDVTFPDLDGSSSFTKPTP